MYIKLNNLLEKRCVLITRDSLSIELKAYEKAIDCPVNIGGNGPKNNILLFN